MNKYTVRLKSAVYYDVDIEAEDDHEAREQGVDILSKMLENTFLPMPLEFDMIEVWDVEETE